MKTVGLLAAVVFLAAACSGKQIEPNYYLLRPAVKPESRQLTPSADFALGKISIASYLDQPGLLLETSDGEIRPARHHLWAEPVYEGVHSFLVKEISRARGEDILPARLKRDALVVVEVRVEELHGTADGQAVLVGYWWLRRDGEVLAAYQFSESKTLNDDGYQALVHAERALLVQLAEKIAASMTLPATPG
jgi:uncharacterized lipoprotein YmbA